jgi:hypothetical protein
LLFWNFWQCNCPGVGRFFHFSAFGPFVRSKHVPQGNPRLDVPQAFLDAALQRLQKHVHNSPAELAFNLDENGISEWEARALLKVIVPSAMKDEAFITASAGN